MSKEKQSAIEHIAELKKQIEKYEQIVNAPDKPAAKEWLEKKWFEAYRNSGNSTDNCATFYENSKRNSYDWLFQQDLKYKKLHYNCDKIYLFLEREYKLSYNEINSLVMDVVGKDINCEGLTPDGFRTLDDVVVKI